MYIFEMKGKLPTRADKASLGWDRTQSQPSRDGKTITLPWEDKDFYFPLREGKQFLFASKRRSESVWFGGTDEEPFLVEMQRQALDAYVNTSGSEQDFYRALVPERVLEMAQENHESYRRQGDIFATRFCSEPYFEKSISRLAHCKVTEGETRILGTRHQGRGRCIIFDPHATSPSNILFKGVIEAPDHAPLRLEDGFYLLGQTRHIVQPTQAD